MNILVAKNGSQLGPFSESDVRAKLASGEFAPTDFGWKEGMSAWSPLSQMLADAPSAAAPQTPSPSAAPQGQSSAPSSYSPQGQSYSPQGQSGAQTSYSPQGQSYSPQGQSPAPQGQSPSYSPQGQGNAPASYSPQGQQPSYSPQPYNAPQGQYSAPQTYNSPYPSPYQQGAVQQWGAQGANTYAGFWLRVVAFLIDFIPLFIVNSIVNYVVISIFRDRGMVFIGSIINLVTNWLYFAYLESSANQATLGKMVMGLKVTDMNGNRISFLQATGRYFGKIVSGLILCVGFMMAGFTERKQALHDIMAGTLVARK